MTTYTGSAPLTMVRLVNKSFQNVFAGETIAGETIDPENLKRHLRKGFLVKTEDPADDEPTPGSEKAILKDVGDDKALAQVALDEEKAKGDSARKGLVAKLEKILSA